MTITNILAAVDFSDASRAACNAAVVCARRYGASLHLVHVAQNTSPDAESAERARLPSFVAAAGAPDGTRSIVLCSSRPAEALLEYAEAAHIDLIVLGTHGQSGLADLFMGSVALQVLGRAPCPVLTLRRSDDGLFALGGNDSASPLSA